MSWPNDECQEQFALEIPVLMERERIPGVSLAFISDGHVSYRATFGVADAVRQTPVTVDTIFEAASLSKPPFAYAVLKLCESNGINLDTPLAEYLPMPYIKDDLKHQLITARHVLSHTTGFPNWRGKQPLTIHFTPGERHSYSGEGFVYLQHVLSHRLAQPLVGWLKDSIFEPLGMSASSFLWTGQEKKPVTVGHDREGNPVPKKLSTEMNAAYSLHCTPTDFATFVNFVMEQPDNHHLRLPPDLYEEMLTPQIAVNDSMFWQKDWPKSEIRLHDSVFWGLGWGLVKATDSFSLWHWGDNNITKAFVVAFPKIRQGIVMMGNSQNAARIWSDILIRSIGEANPGLDWVKTNLGL